MKNLETLNNIYEELHNDKNIIIEYLNENEIPYTVGYYPFHSFKNEEGFYLEQYPLPVITISSMIDVGIDLDKVFFEFKFTKDTAVEFDFHLFDMFQFEVYGVLDYYNDYYFGNIDEINNNILQSNEEEIGISILINKENILEDTKNVLDLLSHLL